MNLMKNPSMPLISVIMPVYNAEKKVRAAVESVLSQSYPNLELIIINDGSRDGSLAVCQALARQDSRIRLIDQPNGGCAAARNRGLDEMQGEYLMFVDSDDRLAPNACRQLVDALGESDLVIAHYYFELGEARAEKGLLNGNRVLNESEFFDELIKRPGAFYFSALWNKIYRVALVRQLGLRFDPFLRWGEDFAFNMQYNRAVHQAALLDVPVYHYVKDVTGASMSWALNIPQSIRIKARLYRLFKALYAEKGLYRQHRLMIRRYIFNVTLTD